jgi:hypothetical protein
MKGILVLLLRRNLSVMINESIATTGWRNFLSLIATLAVSVSAEQCVSVIRFSLTMCDKANFVTF